MAYVCSKSNARNAPCQSRNSELAKSKVQGYDWDSNRCDPILSNVAEVNMELFKLLHNYSRGLFFTIDTKPSKVIGD